MTKPNSASNRKLGSSLVSYLGRQIRGSFLQNLAALYVADGLNYLFPLLLLPFLSRRLGPEAWGQLVMVQSFCQITAMVVDYGFAYTGSRDIARNRDHTEKLSQTVSGVFGARLCLSVISALLLIIGCLVLPQMKQQMGLLVWGYLAAWVPTLSLQWFFQGMEKMQTYARLELINKALSAAFIFSTVRGPTDTWLVFAGNVAGSTMMLIVTLVLIHRRARLCLPNWSMTKEALFSGWHMFVYCSLGTLLSQASNIILGLVGSPRSLAYYSSAERVNRIFTAGLAPVNKALFPRMSNLTARSPKEAAAFLRRMAYVLVGLGALAGLVFFLFADWIVRVLLGNSFAETASVVRIFGLLPPLLSLSYVLGVQWLLPLGHEKILHRILIVTGLCGLTLSYFFGKWWGHNGMAWAVVIAKTLECALYLQMAGSSLAAAPEKLTQATSP